MKELIQKVRKNRNDKYYDLLVTHFQIINKSDERPLRLSVDAIIRSSGISRPTFYSYYTGVQEFYIDLMDVIARIWPQYMQLLSKELDEQNFLKVAFSARLGVTMSNMLKISGKYPGLRDSWNTYLKKAVKKMGLWYSQKYTIGTCEGERVARRVLNELILYDHLYYEDFEKYKKLIFSEITT